MSQFHFHPDDYLDLIRAEIAVFDEFQDRVAQATEGVAAARVLELGTGSGETARRVLARHPESRLTGLDASREMLVAAERLLPAAQVEEFLVRSLQEPLPEGPFDLVVSALTVHHLDDTEKADLFGRLGRVLRPGGRFVLGDVIVPDDPSDAVTPLAPAYDLPSPVDDLRRWLEQAGFEVRLSWEKQDLAVMSADLRSTGPA